MSAYLGAGEIRLLASEAGLQPAKSLGQNFVVDAGTVQRIARVAGIRGDDVVLEIGPGLGSLTLALLPVARHVVAVEIDARLAELLPLTIARKQPANAARLDVRRLDALALDVSAVTTADGLLPNAVVANLPYNVAVPVLLHVLATLPSLRRVLVMVQLEVAERLAASPGSRTYGVPSAKAAWFADVRLAGGVGRQVFWPTPRVDSALVAFELRDPPSTTATRDEVFAVVDAAFGQRRKTLRSALAIWAGSPAAAEAALRAAGVDPGVRGERLDIAAFARIAEQRSRGVS